MGYFDEDTMKFLTGLKRNNNKAWFQKSKPRYEASVKEPFLDFIDDGSLFRIYRDVRFSKDKLRDATR